MSIVLVSTFPSRVESTNIEANFPELLFIGGFGSVGIFSLVAGFVNDKIGLIVLRAVVGLCASIFSADFTRANHERWIVAAMSIPSALSLIVHLFPEPADQAHAIAMFAGGGPIGNSKHLLYCHIIPPI